MQTEEWRERRGRFTHSDFLVLPVGTRVRQDVAWNSADTRDKKVLEFVVVGCAGQDLGGFFGGDILRLETCDSQCHCAFVFFLMCVGSVVVGGVKVKEKKE